MESAISSDTAVLGDNQQKRFTEALCHHRNGRLNQAEQLYRQVLDADPGHADSLHLMGVLAQQVGKHEAAVKFIRAAIAQNDCAGTYYYNLANSLVALNRLAQAVAAYQQCLDRQRAFAPAMTNLGNALHTLGHRDQAVMWYQTALAHQPRDAQTHNNLGSLLSDLGRLDEAVYYFQRALALKPSFALVHYNLGNVYLKTGQNREAVAGYEQAIRAQPGFAAAHNNLGQAFEKQSRFKQAEHAYQCAITHDHHHIEAHINRGNLARNRNLPTQAIDSYRQALQISPDNSKALNGLVAQLQEICAWDELESYAHQLDRQTRNAVRARQKPGESPLGNLTRHQDPALNLAVARLWSREIGANVAARNPMFSFEDRRQPDQRRLRIGYLSRDFRQHPVALLTRRLYRLHDRRQFEVFGYSYGPDDGSIYRRNAQQDCDAFVDIVDFSAVQAARRIFADRIDILVDMAGHTFNNRLEICALRPAPVQVSYLGFLGTTGAGFIDYLIADRHVLPEAHTPYYTEKPVLLPDCYQLNDDSLPVSTSDSQRSDFNLPQDAFVFCCFNQAHKIDCELFHAWMKILNAVPQSVLWLLARNEPVRQNLIREALRAGVDAHRLVFAAKCDLHAHLARHQLADLALDTQTYNGGATTSLALWCGVPVLTLQGRHFVSRMSAAALNALNLPEMITTSLDAYEARAVELATDRTKLDVLKNKVRRNRKTAPLFDTGRFVRNLEQAYHQMWALFAHGQAPRRIDLRATRNP